MRRVTTILDDRLADAGSTLVVQGHINESGYFLGGHDFRLPNGLDYDLVLTNAGKGILVTGLVTGRVLGTCDRCLEEAVLDLTGEVEEYYLFKAQEAIADGGDTLGDDDEMDFSWVGEDHTIDLTDAISSALLMETPYVVLCREDCKGLCPVCGENLNQVDCGHGAQIERRREEERMASGPFSALRKLRLEDAGCEAE